MDDSAVSLDFDISTRKESAKAPHLLHVFPSYGHGGVPIRIATVINHFSDRYRHSILALDGNKAAQNRLDKALNVAVSDPNMDKKRPIWTLFHIRKSLIGHKPDLLLTYNWGSAEWALINCLSPVAPHIHFESGFGPEEADGQIARRVWARRIALARIKALVVPSHTLVSIAGEIWRIRKDKIRHIANGVDCALFAAAGDAAAAPGFTRREGELIIGTIAPLRVEKNLHRLIRAFAAIADRHNTRLLIAGDGVERPALEKTVADLGVADRVVFTGHVEHPERVSPLMDIFAISSDTEQMPNTLIQAMAASRPVAGVDVGDVKANLSPENRAEIVSKSDEAGFAASLDRLLADQPLRESLSVANRNHVVEQYSSQRMFENYGRIFDEALGASVKN